MGDDGHLETLAGSGVGSGEASPLSGLPVASWDRYELLRELGHGGMGMVFEARDRKLGRVVALKFIRGSDPRGTMRLLQEARAQARVDHPNVCKIFEIGEVDGRAYIAMQLIDGKPLAEVGARASLHEKVMIVRDVALALHEAHTLGVLHRDIKPANILVEIDGDGRLHPVVVDFGLARHESEEHGLTQSGAVMGTPAYMPPEQARGAQGALDRRSDVYGLGATLYELLGGAPPFGGTPGMIMLAVLNHEPRPLRAFAPSVPVDLETIAAKCLAKEPGQRYDSARALAEDLDRYVRGEPILGRKASLSQRLWRRARRHRALVATAALSLVALGVVGGLAVNARLQARRNERLSQDVKEVEWFLRTARLAPVHDLTPELEVVRRRIALAAERTGESALASYAVGRGHLALEEYPEARRHLEAALAGGVDTPDLHLALGVVLAELHAAALLEVLRAGGPSAAQRTSELEAELFVPAMASFERAHGAILASSTYLDALIAFHRKDYATAIGSARKAHAEAPWLYEALLIEGESHLRLAGPRAMAHNPAADGDLDAAARAFEAAMEYARSDFRPYIGRAEVTIHRSYIAVESGAAFTDSFERAEDWCRQAAIIVPTSAGPRTKLARLRLYWARYLHARGQDPEPVARVAVETARVAVSLDDREFHAHMYLAQLQAERAAWLVAKNAAATEVIDDAIVEFKRAAEIDPHNWNAPLGLAAVHLQRAKTLVAEGADPDPAFREAAELLAAVLRVTSGQEVHRLRLELYEAWATSLADRGRSPEPLALAAADAFASCVRETGAASACHEGAAGYRVALVAYKIDAGVDVARDLDELDGLLAKVAAPRLYTRRVAARAALLRVRVALRDGADPAPARASLAHAVAACAEDDVCAGIGANERSRQAQSSSP